MRTSQIYLLVAYMCLVGSIITSNLFSTFFLIGLSIAEFIGYLYFSFIELKELKNEILLKEFLLKQTKKRSYKKCQH